MASMLSLFSRMFGRSQSRPGGTTVARGNGEAAAWVIGLLDIRPTDRILEIGFGRGVGIQLLAERASAGRISGIDALPEMLGQATARNREAISSGRVRLELGSADRLPFADASFETVLAIDAMHHWPDRLAALREMRRVLKVAGRIAVAFSADAGQSKSGQAETLTAAGFMAPELVEKGGTFCWLATKP
jgi:ubiquinone/menaquinone biosynthesis C-methylase UbiE